MSLSLDIYLYIYIYIYIYDRLYESWPWDDKAIRKLIGDGKLAPRLKGCDRREVVKQEECPICFFHYGQMNKTGCCKAYVCTECYLQVRPQKLQTGNNNSDVGCCPFCNTPKFTTTLAMLTDEGGMKRDLEEKKTLEAQMRARANSEATVSSNGDCLDSPHVPDSTIISEEKQDEDCENRDPASPKIMPSETIGMDSDQFGASLSRDLARRRTLSNVSDSSPVKSQNKDSEIVIVASVEERKQVEEDMKKQIYHPLARQVAEETSVASASLPQGSRGRGRLGSNVRRRILGSSRRPDRDWNEIINAYERGGGEVQSLDDLVVLEAAIILSMEEQARMENAGEQNQQLHQRSTAVNNILRRHAYDLRTGSLGSRSRRFRGASPQEMFMRSLTEEEQIAMAINMSLRDTQANSASSGNEESNNATEGSNSESQNDESTPLGNSDNNA